MKCSFKLLGGYWNMANKVCTDLGKSILSDGIETTEKRKKMCKEIGVNKVNNRNIWTDITKTTGTWRHLDGRSLDGSFQFDWIPGNPRMVHNNGWDFMLIHCNE